MVQCNSCFPDDDHLGQLNCFKHNLFSVLPGTQTMLIWLSVLWANLTKCTNGINLNLRILSNTIDAPYFQTFLNIYGFWGKNGAPDGRFWSARTRGHPFFPPLLSLSVLLGGSHICGDSVPRSKLCTYPPLHQPPHPPVGSILGSEHVLEVASSHLGRELLRSGYQHLLGGHGL